MENFNHFELNSATLNNSQAVAPPLARDFYAESYELRRNAWLPA